MDLSILERINFEFWALQTVAMLLTALIIPKLRVSGPLGALLAVIALAFVNANVWSWALFFSIPDTFTSRSITLFVANGLIFWVVAKILPGIQVEGILPALVAPIVFTVCSIVVGEYGTRINWTELFRSTLSFVEQTKSNLEQHSDRPEPAENQSQMQSTHEL